MINKIKEKPIIIIGQGPSAKNLEDRIQEFKGKDVLWASLNRFKLIDKEILSQISQRLDIIYCSSDERFKQSMEHIKDHLRWDGVFISTHKIYASMSRMFSHKDLSLTYGADWGYGFSSIFAMLCALGKMDARRIYLVGFDGEARGGKTYYKQEQLNDNMDARATSIAADTRMMNKIFWDYWKHIGLGQISIRNLLGSSIECFGQLSLDDMLEEI